MKYRADIFTDVGLFIAEIPDTDKPLDPHIVITKIRLCIKNLEDFKGWPPYADLSEPASSFTIEEDTKLHSIRLYETVENIAPELTGAPQNSLPTTPYPFTYFGEYLGVKLKITGVALKTETTEYLLPLLINDNPANAAMKPSELSQQIQHYKERDGIPATEYLVITPDVTLNTPTASEYITDYVNEVEPTTEIKGGSKAKAWQGWNEKE